MRNRTQYIDWPLYWLAPLRSTVYDSIYVLFTIDHLRSDMLLQLMTGAPPRGGMNDLNESWTMTNRQLKPRFHRTHERWDTLFWLLRHAREYELRALRWMELHRSTPRSRAQNDSDYKYWNRRQNIITRCTDLHHLRRRSVSTSGISWQQTETAICYSRRPRHQPNYHALWCPVICRSRTQSLESASGRHSCDWLSQLL